jgi:serine/threonine-protein kinase
VLVIDDDPVVRELVATILEPMGAEVHEASSGEAGLQALREAQPDLIVLDISMPGVDGWEVLDRIRSVSDMPVLMLTAHEGEQDMVRALKGGADDYVAKPLSAAEFAARVEALLRRAARRPSSIPTEFAGYRLESELGRGGMGVVYRARHLSLDRIVALKVLPPDSAPDEVARERFIREWKTTADVAHPGIVAVHDAGEIEGYLYLAMELVEGPDLRTLLDREGPMALERTTAIVDQVSSALDAAHARGVIHRDVKPPNILLAGGQAWLSDFGLAKISDPSRVLSSPGQALGTAEYLAPEQIRGEPVSPATDVYGLGCVIFEMLTGRAPFADVQPSIALLYAHVGSPPPPIGKFREGIPEAVEAVVERALAKDPAERHQAAGELAGDLRSAAGA